MPVEGLTGVKRLVLGDNNVIVLKEDGTVWGWGSNHGGELSDGTTEKRYRPVQAKDIANAVDIAMGDEAVIVLADGTMWMCGNSTEASMADAPSGAHAMPFKIAGITTAVAAQTAGTTMVRLKDDTVMRWGYYTRGSVEWALKPVAWYKTPLP